MNIVYDKQINLLLCPKCSGIAHWTKEGLQCEEPDCKFFYHTFVDDKTINIFQMELFNEMP